MREWAVAQIDAEAVIDQVADFLADIDDAEVSGAGDVEPEVKGGVWALGTVVDEVLRGGEEAEVRVFAGGDHFKGDEGGGLVGGDAAVFLEPVFVVDGFGTEAAYEGEA